MRYFVLLTSLLVFTSLFFAQKPCPVITPKSSVVDTFFQSYIVKDDYRWLENTTSEQSVNWVKEQNKYSKRVIAKSLANTNAKKWIDQYAYYKNKSVHKEGDYFFSYRYYNELAVPSLFYRTKYKGEDYELVDPNYISSTDKIDIKGYNLSGNSEYLAYEFDRNGSDWAEVRVVDIKKERHIKDHLSGLKFSNLAWKGDGFFYCTYKQNGKFGTLQEQQIFFHKLNTSQEEDKLIFDRKNPYLDFDFKTSHNERFFIVKERNRITDCTSVFYIDYQMDNPTFRPLVMNHKKGIRILDSYNGKIIAQISNSDNSNMVVEIDPQNPTKWRAITQDYAEAVLLSVKLMKDYIVTVYQSNQQPTMVVFDYTGKVLYKKEFEIASSVYGLNANYNDNEVYYKFSSYTVPSVVFKLNLDLFKSELVSSTKISFSYKDIEYKTVEYLSEDSIKVPMILVYKKGLKLDGNNPTILKAYGGFGVVATPYFDPGVVYFIKNGGVFAFANIRGGGDKGKQWAFGGRGEEKQNSFDDFIAGAEYLIKEKYTNPDKLAITGGSNGGLVTAVAAIQRPDLFKVAVPKVAPTDMLRFEKFTVGSFHIKEYGTVSDSTSFVNLYNYSPYHNIKEDVNYPTMLVVTADNDDRVPPFHSYKFVARLQNRPAQKNPIYLKVDKDAGHYGATSTRSSLIKSTSDIYSFILSELED